jgi:endonuclease G
MTNDDEARRFDAARARLDDTPELRAAIAEQAAAGKLPDGLVPPKLSDAVSGGDALESLDIQIDRLEAIVRLVGRPPLVVRNGVIELEPLPEFAAGTDALVRGVEPSVRSVGRVEFLNHSMAWGGTGWVVSAEGPDRVIATNRHVAKVIARRLADGKGVFLRDPVTGQRYGAELDFKEEVDSDPGQATPFAVTEVVYLADDSSPDVALLRITGAGLPDPLRLSPRDAEVGERVGLIGYPAYDPRNDAGAQAQYFKGLFDVKRFAPGFVMQALDGVRGSSLRHDCTSLGGNSGSPLISLETGEVVGLHFAGQYGVANSAVGVGTLRALIEGERPLLTAGFIASAEAHGAEAAGDGTHDAAFFAGREGYDPAFLGDGLAAPWPGIPPVLAADLSRPVDEVGREPFELRYTHFGVKYHGKRRQPLMTAVNIDGGHPVRIKRGDDRWFQDLRIPLEVQLSRRDYGDPEIDRGHMVRREDPNWDPGASGITDVTLRAQRANDDTFHYTNSALQHSRLNQGAALWLGLENHVLESARTQGFKACVFTGPIFRDDDPDLVAGLAVPQEFWKLVVMRAAFGGDAAAAAPRLHATAYLLSQGELIRDLLAQRSLVEGLEGFVLGAYRTFQVAIADLADATGLDLSEYVPADPLGTSRIGTEAIQTGEPLFVPLGSLSEIVT